jgi:hypothetical protein
MRFLVSFDALRLDGSSVRAPTASASVRDTIAGRARWSVFAALVLAVGCGHGPGSINGDDGGDDGDDVMTPDGGRVPPDADNSPDAVPPDAVVPTIDPAIDGQLVINEVMAANAYTITDGTGAAGDWIELYNPTAEDIPLFGYGITDNLMMPTRYLLQDVVAPAGGHLLLWADGNPGAGVDHLGLHLAKDGGEVGLARPDGSYIDRVRYDVQETDFSASREPDGSDLWVIEWHPSPGAANPAGAGQPMGLEVEADPPELIPAAGDLSARIYDNTSLPEFTLIVSPASAAALEASPFAYVPAEIVYDGRTYGPIGIRCKGSNSFEPFSQKPSLRLKMDEYNADARFFGLKDLTFNNMDNDPSMMHERLAYLVSRTVGIPSSRANHMLLHVNDQFYGLYTNVETVKKKMLGRWYADAEGSLFEATDVDFVANKILQYSLESGPDDRTLLWGLANALTEPTGDGAMAAAASYADLAQFQTFWAMTSVIGQFDSFPYSIPGDDYFVYANPATGRLEFLPWGMDETFSASDFNVTWTYSVLAARCKESATCWQGYVDATWRVLDQTDAIDLVGERDRVAAQIAPWVAADTRKPYTDEQVAAAQSAVHWFIKERRATMAGYLPPASTP